MSSQLNLLFPDPIFKLGMQYFVSDKEWIRSLTTFYLDLALGNNVKELLTNTKGRAFSKSWSMEKLKFWCQCMGWENPNYIQSQYHSSKAAGFVRTCGVQGRAMETSKGPDKYWQIFHFFFLGNPDS